jgi:hypothetical protein
MPIVSEVTGTSAATGVGEVLMGTGVSLFLIAVGAILTWAVTSTVSGIDIAAVGVILMIVGAIGLLLSLVFWSSFGGYGFTRRDTTIVDGRDHVTHDHV